MEINNKLLSKIVYFETIDSTNEYLLNNYESLDNSTLVITNNQTSGRGRKGHNWVSSGDNIYMSLLLKPANLDSPNLLTLIAGLSLSKTLDKLYSINTLIKWPNDIFFNSKKLAGILVETKYTSKLECVVIGIGINVNQLDFNNSELSNATSLLKETNRSIKKEVIINEFINTFYDLFNVFNTQGFSSFVSEINNKLFLINKEIYVTNNPLINGKCIGINDIGELLIDNNKKITNLNSNEVSIKVK